MTNERKKLLKKLVEYAQADMNGECDEGTGFLSAMVNLVDTAREEPERFGRRAQVYREEEIVLFILSHNSM
jgi:hypothetical protein